MQRAMASLRKSLKDDAIAAALGFWEARMAVLDRIATEFPALKDKATRAKADFEAAFKPGRDALLETFLSRGGEQRKADWAKAQSDSRQQAAKQSLKEESLAKAFDAGSLDPREQKPQYVRLFLSMDPRHQKDPLFALERGFFQTTPLADKDGKAFGSVTLPATFSVIKGAQLGDDLTLAFGGFGPATISITVRPLSAPVEAQQAIDSLVNGKAPGLTAHAEKSRVIETPAGKAGLVPIDIAIDAGDEKTMAGRGEMLLLPAGTRLIGIMCTVQTGGGADQSERLDALLRLFEPLFERVRGSMLLTPPKGP